VPQVFFDVKVEGQPAGRIVISLFDDVKTASQRFADLAEEKEGVGYRLSKFDGIFPVSDSRWLTVRSGPKGTYTTVSCLIARHMFGWLRPACAGLDGRMQQAVRAPLISCCLLT
jgi:hypothetical protein